MSDIIKLLPDAIANQIAAGEVISRPASAVKELLENAIDAGSTRIQLIVKNAGKTLIQIIDNGKGMSPTDARLCFERHATSKIREANDLFSIQTMGFRGEALASIAAIAHVELKTRPEEDELGTRIVIEGSKVTVQEACQCAKGTSISIKNLFFNIPARRKFLKSNPVETRHILDEFQRVALAHPEIFLTVHNNGHEIYHLKKGNEKKRIVSVMGKNFDERLVPINEKTDFLKIYGFIGKPQFARKTRGEQFFLVNKRFIKSTYLHRAVMDAYDDLLSKDTYPLYVIYVDIDPAKIDVNVHPTKQEIKFDDEQIIYTFINGAVKRALATYSITPMLDFDQEASLSFSTPPTPSASNKPNLPPPFSLTSKGKSTASFKGSEEDLNNLPTVEKTERDNLKNWQELYKDTGRPSSNAPTQGNKSQFTTMPSSLNTGKRRKTPTETNIEEKIEFQPFQLHQKYIVYHIKSGIIILDQQATHERILFEKYHHSLTNQTSSTQKLLFPHKLQLSTADAQLLSDILPEINALGYTLEAELDNVFTIYGVPSDLQNSRGSTDLDQTFDDLISQFRTNALDLQIDKRTNLARAMARHSAIKAGRLLTTEEMQVLIDQLFACEKPYIAPNGRLTFIKQSLDELDKQFQKRK